MIVVFVAEVIKSLDCHLHRWSLALTLLSTWRLWLKTRFSWPSWHICCTLESGLMPLAFFAWFCLKSTSPKPCLLKIPLRMMWNIKDHLYHSSALGPLWLHQPLVTILSTELGEAHPREDKMESLGVAKTTKMSYESQMRMRFGVQNVTYTFCKCCVCLFSSLFQSLFSSTYIYLPFIFKKTEKKDDSSSTCQIRRNGGNNCHLEHIENQSN